MDVTAGFIDEPIDVLTMDIHTRMGDTILTPMEDIIPTAMEDTIVRPISGDGTSGQGGSHRH
jgi:hypothetical protein